MPAVPVPFVGCGPTRGSAVFSLLHRRTLHNNAWLAGFVGVAPAKLAFACVIYNVEHGDYGAEIAGPMFARFLQELRADPALAKEFL